MIVTIDGPAGAGKSTAARALAQRLGFDFLDTGAMYRAVALAGQRAAVDFNDVEAVDRLLKGIHLQMPGGCVMLNNEDVTSLLRTPEITQRSRAVADCPPVRRFLGHLQRQFAAGRNIVSEGRDQGTVVFPDAECKFFLTAGPDIRAARRHAEMTSRGAPTTLEEVRQAQKERDARDAERAIAPMKPAADAILVDSSGLTAAAVVDFMEQHVRSRLRK